MTAADTLIRSVWDLAWMFAYRAVRRHHLTPAEQWAEELHAVALAGAARSLLTYDPDGKASWVTYSGNGMDMAVRRYLRDRRLKSRWDGRETVPLPATLTDRHSGEGQRQHDFADWADHLLRHLGERDRYLVEQVHIRGRSCRDVAADLGCSYTRAGQLLARAIQRLRETAAADLAAEERA